VPEASFHAEFIAPHILELQLADLQRPPGIDDHVGMLDDEQVQIGIAIDDLHRQTAEHCDIRDHALDFRPSLVVEFIKRQILNHALLEGVARVSLGRIQRLIRAEYPSRG